MGGADDVGVAAQSGAPPLCTASSFLGVYICSRQVTIGHLLRALPVQRAFFCLPPTTCNSTQAQLSSNVDSSSSSSSDDSEDSAAALTSLRNLIIFWTTAISCLAIRGRATFRVSTGTSDSSGRVRESSSADSARKGCCGDLRGRQQRKSSRRQQRQQIEGSQRAARCVWRWFRAQRSVAVQSRCCCSDHAACSRQLDVEQEVCTSDQSCCLPPVLLDRCRPGGSAGQGAGSADWHCRAEQARQEGPVSDSLWESTADGQFVFLI